MKDWTKPLRKAYYDALATHVVIESAQVPVWQDKLPEDQPATRYIVIAETLGTNISSLDHFAGDVLVNVEIAAIGGGELANYVDDMTDQVKNLILPTRTTSGLAPQAGFHFSSVRWDNDIDIPVLQTATGYIKRKIIRYRQNIVDNN